MTFTESTADILAISEIVGKKLSPADLAFGLATEGLSAILGGVFNSFPDTAYAQNVGLVRLTTVRSRFVVAVAGGILLVLGLLPPLGQIIAPAWSRDWWRVAGDVCDRYWRRHSDARTRVVRWQQ